MKAHILHTPEAQAEWDALILERDTHATALRGVDRAMEALAAKTFEHLLRTGKWKVTGYNKIVPADSAAEDQIESLISTAFKLGYHDSFGVSDGKVKIYGQVNDGDLTLDMYPTRMKDGFDADETQAAFDELQVDVDLSEWAADLREQAIAQARREIVAAQQRIKALSKEPG